MESWEGTDCIHLSQDRAKWQADMNIVMNFQVICDYVIS